jgi:hypothetical protein
MTFKVTVVDRDLEELEYENVVGFMVPDGALWLDHMDGSTTIYAPGAWLEADASRVNPNAPAPVGPADYQV